MGLQTGCFGWRGSIVVNDSTGCCLLLVVRARDNVGDRDVLANPASEMVSFAEVGYLSAGMYIHASCRAPAPVGRCRPSYAYYDVTLCSHGSSTRAKTCVCLAEAAMPAHPRHINWLPCCCVPCDALCDRPYPPPLFPTPFPLLLLAVLLALLAHQALPVYVVPRKIPPPIQHLAPGCENRSSCCIS